MHETKIELEYGMISEELANASINPKYRTVRHWYDNWKLNNLGSPTALGILQVYFYYFYYIHLYHFFFIMIHK